MTVINRNEYMENILTYNDFLKLTFIAEVMIAVVFRMEDPTEAAKGFYRLFTNKFVEETDRVNSLKRPQHKKEIPALDMTGIPTIPEKEDGKRDNNMEASIGA